MSISTLRRYLVAATLCYLALPVVLFLAGWLKALISLPLTALFLVSVGRLLWAYGRPGPDHRPVELIAPRRLVVFVMIVSVPVLLGGSGGVGWQTWDWQKHNAVLADLVYQTWPVAYLIDESRITLNYYVAFYLPAAIAGKLAGWPAANLVLFLTTWFGTLLAAFWLLVLGWSRPVPCALVFVFFSGMDVAGALLVGAFDSLTEIFTVNFLEHWAWSWIYHANVTLIYNVPHQAVAAWLSVALLIDAMGRQRPDLPVILLLAMAGLWSPLVAIGLLPFFALYQCRSTAGRAVAGMFTGSGNLAGWLIGLILVAYYQSRYLPFNLPGPVQSTDRGAFRLLLGTLGHGDGVTRYLVFVFCEFLLLAALLAPVSKIRARPEDRTLLILAAVVLLILPLFHYGIYNDLVMQASIPALYVLQVLLLRGFQLPLSGSVRAALIIVLLTGTLHSANQLRMHVRIAMDRGELVRVPERPQGSMLPPLGKCWSLWPEFIRQYLGSDQSVFFRYLARDPGPSNVELRFDDCEKG